MFDYQKDYRFAWPVKVLVPTMDGQVEKMFTGLFRLVGKEESEQIEKDFAGLAPSELMRRYWIGWKDDLTRDGAPLSYSDAMRDELLALPFVASAVSVAYWRAVTGALREKN